MYSDKITAFVCLSNEEIKKALLCCSKSPEEGYCTQCPLKDDEHCTEDLPAVALARIEGLERGYQ